MLTISVFVLVYNAMFCLSTVDINVPEFRYIANHLHHDECRRLSAALHFSSYELPNTLQDAERTIPKDTHCLDLLLHWNSAKGEGKGETHEALEHRLRQLGHYKLADWLGRNVFHELSLDIDNSLRDPFASINFTELYPSSSSNPEGIIEPLKVNDPSQWTQLDTIVAFACILSSVLLIAIIVKLICYKCCQQKY